MARSGGFGPSLNPLGGGSFGGLGKYDIGADLADLEVYKTEVAWGNGLATDAEYLAALQKSVNATDPNTQRRETAQNKMDDAVYRIGRSKVAGNIDSLIAFDQASIAKMNPENLRYRDIKNSLDSELAQRRSRDYGKLVTDYNAGKRTTASLLAWVNSALGTISPDDPDFDNWTSTKADLTDRVASEKDSVVYQDFQQGRMKAPAFLAYLTARRNTFEVGSPQRADWDRRLEDAQKQVKDQAQAKTDAAFFNAYEEGKKSDSQYLSYIRGRINKMPADDPDRPSWQHRLNQATFSLAEDKLRFDVQMGKQPVSKLVSFYRSYRATLNPGSAEWRTVTRALDALHGGGVGGGGGGGGGSRSSGTSKAGGVGAGIALPKGKVITPTTVEGALALMTVNPFASKKDQALAKKQFKLNYTSMENARQRGDDVFLFFDPRHPTAIVAGRNPDGSPMLDAKGKPIMVRGSSYLPVSDDLFGKMNVLDANYHFTLAEIALHQHNAAGYADNMRQGLNAQDKARLVQSQSIQKSYDAFYKQAQDGIDAALRTGDYATALNLSQEVANRIKNELESNPFLDDTRRNKLDSLGEKLAANPLIPKVDPATGQQIGGAVDLAGSERDAQGNFLGVALNPGWHHVLDDTTPSGAAQWGLHYDDVQDGSWEQSHREISTGYGGAVVKGEVSIRKAGVNPTVFVTTDDGMIRVDQSAQYIAFPDENGNLVRAYSLDGKTWVRSLSGTAPQVEVNAHLNKASDGSGLVDDQGNLVFKANEPGNASAGYQFVGNPALIGWYGQAAHAARNDPHVNAAGEVFDQSVPYLSGKERDDRAVYGRNGAFLGYRQAPQDLGAPGQQMQLLTAGGDGSLTFLSDRQQDDYERKLLGTRGGPGATRSLGNPQRSALYDATYGALGTTMTAGITSVLSGLLSPGQGLKATPPPPKQLPTLPPEMYTQNRILPQTKLAPPRPLPVLPQTRLPPPPKPKPPKPTVISAGKAKDDIARVPPPPKPKAAPLPLAPRSGGARPS